MANPVEVADADYLANLVAQRKPFLAKVPIELYRQVDAANFSVLKAMQRSPKFGRMMQRSERISPALNFGTALHAVLEGESERIAVKPKWNLRKKADKQAAAAWHANQVGKIVISDDERQTIHAIENNAMAKSRIRSIRHNALVEISGFYFHPDFEVPCKIRMDLYRPDQRIIVDFKSTQDASAQGFRRSAYKFGYHMQAAYYLDALTAITGKRHDTFLIIALEKYAPFDANVFCIDPEDIEIGREQYLKTLQVYKQCTGSGVWPGYTDEIKPIKICPARKDF